jgi:hypothetical protein
VLTSVLSETEGARPPPTAFSSHPGRHNVATETRWRPRPAERSLHNTDTQPRTFNEQIQRKARRPSLGQSTAPFHTACFITAPASKLAPLFHAAKVRAAILRAIVTRASSGCSPLARSPAYHDLKGSHREAACAAPLKTYFSVRL